MDARISSTTSETATLTFERRALYKALQHATLFTVRPRKYNTPPILQTVLIEPLGSTARLTATDLEKRYSVDLPCASPAACVTPFAVEAQALTALLRTSSAEYVTLQPGEYNCQATMDENGTSGLPQCNVEDFPAVRAPLSFAHGYEITAADLRRLLETVARFQSSEPTRYYLNGVFMEWGATGMAVTATDGHRLAHAETEDYQKAAKPSDLNVIIPSGTVGALLKLLPKGSDPVRLEIAENGSEARFTLPGNAVVTTKTVDGSFPAYERVIPRRQDVDMQLRCDAPTLARAIKLATVVVRAPRRQDVDMQLRCDAPTLARAIKLATVVVRAPRQPVYIVCSHDGVHVQAGTPENGISTRPVAGARWIGPDFTILAKVLYWLDILAQIPGGSVVVHMGGDAGKPDAALPMLVEAPANPRALFVLMPMRH
jgi:DNA polymerase III subunit beta